MPDTMKAAVIDAFEGIDTVKIDQIPIPLPQDGEVQIAVKCAGVNPVDWKICDGALQNMMESEFPITLGWDVSGIVSAVGAGVTHLKEGDDVFAYTRKKTIHDGSFAEFLCYPAQHVVHKPKNLTHAQAACIPLSTLTAWQSLFDNAHLQQGENILIHAGAGGVGGFAIQLAKYAGAHVITTTSPSNFDYVKQLGADEVIDYTHENFVDKIHSTAPTGVDVAYDTVGGTTLNATYDAVKQGGRLITIAGVVNKTLTTQHALQADFVLVAPHGEELQKIADLFTAEKLHLPHIEILPFQEVKTALHKSRAGHTQGKLVLQIAETSESGTF